MTSARSPERTEEPERLEGGELDGPGRLSQVSSFVDRWDVSRDALIASGILLLPVVVISVAFFPGHMNSDTLTMIDQVDSGMLTNQWAPLLQALWTPFWDLGAGPGWVLVAQLLCFVIGAYLVLRAAFRPIGAALVVALIAFSPPVLANLGTVLRDTWFLVLLLLTFGLVVRAAQSPWPVRKGYLILALVAAWLTLASRQNGALAVALACISIVGLVLAHRREMASEGQRPEQVMGRRGLLVAVGGGIALTVALLLTQLGAAAVIGVKDQHPESPLYVYDLAAISDREGENLFPPEAIPEKRGFRIVERNFNVDSMTGFLFILFLPVEQLPQRVTPLRDAWFDAVRDDPGTYLSERWTLWMRQIGVTRDALTTYFPGIDPFANRRGYQLANPSLDGYATDYEDAFADDHQNGNWIYATWAYLLVAAAGAIVLLRRGRSWSMLVVGALALSALSFQIGLFFGAPGTQFRFEFPCVVIGMLAAAVLLRFAWARWRAASSTEA